MNDDERAIRALIDKWLSATRAGDYATVLSLMAEDVMFMVPGQEPFGKQAFAASAEVMKNMQIDGTSEIQELKVFADWAWVRNRLRVTVTPPNGQKIVRSGYTLTILRKEPDGRWVLARDANLVTTETK